MKKLQKSVSILLTVLTVAGCIIAVPFTARAATDTAYYTDKKGKTTYYSDAGDAWTKAVENNGIFGLLQDWNCDRRVVTENHSVTVELNGHVLTRRKATWSSDGEVIFVGDNASLTVYGGTKAQPTKGRSTDHTEQAYVSTSDGFIRQSVPFKGGMIHGGNSSNGAGGIHMKKNATVKLYYTTIAGNRAEQTMNADGYGGGIMVDGANGKILLDHSTISYNYAYNDGGGVYVHKDAQRCTIEMIKSHIDRNICIDNGAGIAVDAEHFRLIGDAVQTMNPESVTNWDADKLGSTVSHNTITDSDNDGGGAGLYLWNDYAFIKGVTITGNTARSGGNGGGVFILEKNVTLTGCNIACNSADKLGGGIYNTESGNTIENTTVYDNGAYDTDGAGGGVYTKGDSNITISGTDIIRGNSSQTYAKDNLYLPGQLSAEFTAFIVPKLKTGADVHIRTSSSHGNRLSTFGAFRDDFYTYDNSTSKHIMWSSGDRCLSVRSGAKPQKKVAVFTPDDGKTTQAVSGGYQTGGKTYPLVKGVSQMPSCTGSNADVQSVFYYSDGYFMSDSKAYNAHLATLSMHLAGAAGYSNTVTDDEHTYLDKSKNFRQLMSDIGCKDENIYVNDFNVTKPNTDSIGVGIASKALPGDETLVIIGVRGMGYEAEWVSNMTLGASGEAKGFSSAAKQAFSELKSYLKRYGIDGKSNKTKFWIAGYSRAGATANLTAKRIVDTYDNSGERTFAYPVEAPKGGVESAKQSGSDYSCIHNIINQNDIVPWVGTTEMGLIRYGIDHYVPGNATSAAANSPWNVSSDKYAAQKEKMTAQLSAVNSEIPFDDYFHPATINYIAGAALSSFGWKMIAETYDESWTTEEYISLFFEKLQEYALYYGDHPRTTYASTVAAGGKTFEQAAATAAGMMFGKPQEQLDGILACCQSLPERISKTDLAKMYAAIRSGDLGIGGAWWKDTRDVLWSKLTTLSEDDEACGYHTLDEYLTAQELSELESSFDALMVPLIHLLCMDYQNHNQNLLGTLVYNISSILSNHYPEVTCAWLRSYDSFYATDTTAVSLSADVQRLPSATAARIISADKTVRTVTDNSEIIALKSDDRLSFVPSDEADIDVGAAVYYQYTSGSDPYRAISIPLLPVTVEGAADGGVFEINTLSSHYGRMRRDKAFCFQITQTAVQLGDVNRDGAVTIDDGTLLQRHLAKFITLSAGELAAADADGDGRFSINDVTAIQRHLANLQFLPVIYI